jgi:hypothetical protein
VFSGLDLLDYDFLSLSKDGFCTRSCKAGGKSAKPHMLLDGF